MKEITSDSDAKLLIDMISRKAPEYLDLLTSNNAEEFLEALDVLISQAVDKLQTNSKNYRSLDEEGLTAAFCSRLEIPGLTVTQETNSNGHVDVTIIADHCTPVRKVLGEAKIYKGPEYHFGGLNQLLGRYLTGWELHGLLIFYHRNKNIAESVRTLRERMDTKHPCQQQGTTSDCKLKWSFLSTHMHSSGEALKVEHIGCNLFFEVTPS